MIRSYIYTIIVSSFALLILSACHNDVVEVDNDQQVPILFSGSFTSEGVGTGDLKSAGVRAATTLPEGTKIVVVGANAGAKSPIASDWGASNLYLNHVLGTVGTPTWVHPAPTAEYPITLENNSSITDGKWYWPFNPNEYLGFMAYTPIPSEVGGDDRVERKDMDLTVTAGKGVDFLPDLLYTGKLGNYNKTEKKVLLPFKHAMARLAVKVIVVDQDDNILPVGQHPVNQIEISSLVIKTKVNEGVFGLSDSKWNSLESTTDYQTAYTLASETSTLPLPYDNSETSVCYLFPSTTTTDVVDLTGIEFKVRDKNTNVVVGDLYPLKSFLQADGITPVTLEMGKTTLLIIKVRYVRIPDPDPDIILQGQLVEWDYKGKSEVVIE